MPITSRRFRPRGAIVAAPRSVSITFTEGVKVPLSGISIVKPDSTLIETLVIKGGADPATITGAVTKPLAPGKYVIKWKNGAADDGHLLRGAFSFTVK